jgi:oxygen-independent coproporphyrinogen-3 oxidase
LAGIYIHIPFCKQACHYCNFHFATSLQYKPSFLAALDKEIELQKNYLGSDIIETIYFGGGTPSLLDNEELIRIIDKIKEVFQVIESCEVTLETNPDDISKEKLIEWRNAGVNRLSIGVQSFFDEDLLWMNRAHNSTQALQSLQLAKQYFDNITIDLIYGSPQLSNDKWKHNVDTALSLDIGHLSCYALTVEPKTPLDKMIRTQKSPNVDAEKQSEQFLLLMEWLQTAGYEHYEISNFAKPGMRSSHNSSYWQGKKYLGFGPSAHSFNGTSRQWNVANNNKYIESIEGGLIPFEIETLTAVQHLNEYIMTALRTMEGINFNVLQNKHGVDKELFLRKTKKFIDHGLVRIDADSLVLTTEGKLLADGISSDLFF